MKIAIISCARIKSKRCPKKMIKKFAGTTLTDIFLKKLYYVGKKLETDTFFSGYENIFKKKCKAHNVRFVQRDKMSSIIDKPAIKIYNFLLKEKYDYFLMINACLPLLTEKTIIKFFRQCLKLKKPCFGVVEKKNYFISKKNKPLNFEKNIKTINTKEVNTVKEFAHIFYFFNRDFFKRKKQYWNWKKVKYLSIPHSIENFDIDTQEDFIIGEILFQNSKKLNLN